MVPLAALCRTVDLMLLVMDALEALRKAGVCARRRSIEEKFDDDREELVEALLLLCG
jgi:hypothetical protein